MSSPFPGMDPYLEGEYWSDFHATLASTIRHQLMQQISPNYVALLDKYFVMQYPSLGIFSPSGRHGLEPDVGVVEKRGAATMGVLTRDPAVMLSAPSAEIATAVPHEVPATRVKIVDKNQQRLVTVIEILSPANKVGRGIAEYDERRLDLVHYMVNLLEIDLLRRGERISLSERQPYGDYYCYLTPLRRNPFTSVWAIQLHERLPVLPVPLLPPDDDVILDLQAAVDSCFELVGYETFLPYDQKPPPPALRQEQMAWVRQRLESADL